MGYIRHHAIMVTGFNKKHVNAARKMADAAFNFDGANMVSKVITSPVNGYYTFFVAPDGSKESADTSAFYDTRRRDFVAYLRDERERERYFSFAVVQYGDDLCETLVVDDSDARNRDVARYNEAKKELAEMRVTLGITADDELD